MEKSKVQFQVKPVFFQENIRCALTKDQCSANIFLKNVASDRQTEAEKYVFLNTSGDRGRVAQLSHVPFGRGGATNSHYEQYGSLVSAFSL